MHRVVIVGYGEMFTNLIAAALDANCKIVGVLRRDTLKYPRFIKKLKDIFNPSKEYSYIKSYNLSEIQAKGVNTEEFRKILLKLNPDIILVGSWPEKFAKETYNIPKIATINAHPSLLPKYRGPNPYFWVIKNKETVSGITFHLMDEGFDEGAILAQEEVKIYPSDTGETLKQRTVLAARGVACELLKALEEDIIIPLKQQDEKSSYFSHPEGLELDFKNSAEDNYALIRAIYPWDETYFYHKFTALTPICSSVYIEENKTHHKEAGTVVQLDSKNKTLGILCGCGKVLKMKVDLYNRQDRPFTQNYLLLEVREGQVLF